MTDQIPWCCTGRGYVSECPLCPEYGTSLLEPYPGHESSEANQTRVAEARLHAERRHPGYEYATTTGPRKQWDDPDRPPSDDRGDPDPSWQPNLDAGYPGAGWERFDYHEEAYWRRPKTPPQAADAPRSAVQVGDGGAEPRHARDGAQAAQGGSGAELLPYPQHAPNACRTTRHCADHGWCHRCNPDFAAVMNRVNIAIQHTDDNDRHWGPLYAAVGQALRGEFAPGSPDNPPEPPAAPIPDGDIQQLAVAILCVQRLIDAHPVSVPTNLLEEALDQTQEQP